MTAPATTLADWLAAQLAAAGGGHHHHDLDDDPRIARMEDERDHGHHDMPGSYDGTGRY